MIDLLLVDLEDSPDILLMFEDGLLAVEQASGGRGIRRRKKTAEEEIEEKRRDEALALRQEEFRRQREEEASLTQWSKDMWAARDAKNHPNTKVEVKVRDSLKILLLKKDVEYQRTGRKKRRD